MCKASFAKTKKRALKARFFVACFILLNSPIALFINGLNFLVIAINWQQEAQ